MEPARNVANGLVGPYKRSARSRPHACSQCRACTAAAPPSHEDTPPEVVLSVAKALLFQESGRMQVGCISVLVVMLAVAGRCPRKDTASGSRYCGTASKSTENPASYETEGA